MNGVVAAGHPDTAEAAASALRAGGNAVDAAIAGCMASFVAEPLLASPGGAGMMTVMLAGQEPAVIDFFSDAPGRGANHVNNYNNINNIDFRTLLVDFGACTQLFHIGRGAAAVPGALPGLLAAHERFGALPLADLVAPAVRLGREGARASPSTELTYRLLRDLVTSDPALRAAMMPGGDLPRVGDRIGNPDLADTLDEIGVLGRVPDRVWEGLLAEFGPARGGLITEDDVRAYAPRVVAPLRVEVGAWAVLLPPAAGGELAATIFRALADGEPAGDEPGETVRLADASQRGHAARPAAVARTQTTHLSAIDAAGGAAAVTFTSGEGSGHVIPGTGIHVNNFLGEEDLNPGGFHRHPPGRRLPTMIAPALAARDGVAALALGSGGANRIRTAIGQVLYRLVARDYALEAAVLAPRVHAEDRDVWLELADLADPAASVHALERRFERIHAFPNRDFFFGGVHAARRAPNGRLEAIGDPRRAGAAVAV